MERLQIRKDYPKTKGKSRFLHSPNHLLADELASRFADMAHFGLYLKLATTHNHDMLRKLASEVLENKNVKSPKKLFSYLIKQQNQKS